MALAAEAAELPEIFQWLTGEQSKDIVNSEKEIAQVKEEIADVFILLSHICSMTSVNLYDAATKKFEILKKRKWLAPDNQGIIRHAK